MLSLPEPPEFIVSDDLTWLDEIIHKVLKISTDSKHFLAVELASHFEFIRAYHGTRTSDVDLYYKFGILPLNPEVFFKEACSIFLIDELPELSEKNVKDAVSKVLGDQRPGNVYFEANEECHIAYCGHYLLYGSEGLIAVAANLPGKRDYRQILKRRGRPTELVCDIPLHLLKRNTLLDLAGGAIATVFEELVNGNQASPNRGEACGFYIEGRLSAQNIVGHYHPRVINDPLTG